MEKTRQEIRILLSLIARPATSPYSIDYIVDELIFMIKDARASGRAPLPRRWMSGTEVQVWPAGKPEEGK